MDKVSPKGDQGQMNSKVKQGLIIAAFAAGVAAAPKFKPQLCVLGVTFGIFAGTLSIKNGKEREAARNAPKLNGGGKA